MPYPFFERRLRLLVPRLARRRADFHCERYGCVNVAGPGSTGVCACSDTLPARLGSFDFVAEFAEVIECHADDVVGHVVGESRRPVVVMLVLGI